MDDIKEIHILEDPQEWYSYLWGKRVCNDDLMFELMSLQVFQAGLTWSSILKRRNEFKFAIGYTKCLKEQI